MRDRTREGLSRWTQSKRDRFVLAITFGLQNVALFVFAALPLYTLLWVEIVVIVGSTVAATMVFLNISDRANKNPVVKFGYLMTAAVALFTLGAFLATYSDSGLWSAETIIPVSLFLLADGAGGIAAHIMVNKVGEPSA